MAKHPIEKNVRPPQAFRTLIEPGTYGPEFRMRENTRMQRFMINFAFNEGGMGDYINYSAATVWIAKNCPWVEGKVFVPEYLMPLMKEIHKDYPHFRIFKGETAGENIDPQTPIVGPEIKMEGRNMNPQLLNATGAHLMDLGFAYFANTCPAPADATLPKLDFSEEKLLPKIKKLHKKYAVIPTGSMTPSRYITGKHLNPVINYVKELGLTPVFLGKKAITGTLEAHFADDINYEAGLDMREQTSVMDAACIMQHAACTVALDCGLLHLAACMKDSRVVFAYNIVRPEDRRPRRNWGKTTEVFLTEDDLACAGCQSKYKCMATHTFHTCFYADKDRLESEAKGEEYLSPRCVDMLFANGAERFKRAIDEVLKD